MSESALSVKELEEFAKVRSITSAGMSLFFQTPVLLFIGDIRGLQCGKESKNVFFYKTKTFSAADIFGVVTGMKGKDDHVQLSVDDGTGSLQCFCPLGVSPWDKVNERITKTFLDKVSKVLKSSILEESVLQRLNIGDYVHVRGSLKQGLWENVVYMSNCTVARVDNQDVQQTWKDRLEEMTILYDVYNATS